MTASNWSLVSPRHKCEETRFNKEKIARWDKKEGKLTPSGNLDAQTSF